MLALKVSDFLYSNTFQEYEKCQIKEKSKSPFCPKSSRKSNLDK